MQHQRHDGDGPPALSQSLSRLGRAMLRGWKGLSAARVEHVCVCVCVCGSDCLVAGAECGTRSGVADGGADRWCACACECERANACVCVSVRVCVCLCLCLCFDCKRGGLECTGWMMGGWGAEVR